MHRFHEILYKGKGNARQSLEHSHKLLSDVVFLYCVQIVYIIFHLHARASSGSSGWSFSRESLRMDVEERRKRNYDLHYGFLFLKYMSPVM